jgi:hypothetical protein
MPPRRVRRCAFPARLTCGWDAPPAERPLQPEESRLPLKGTDEQSLSSGANISSREAAHPANGESPDARTSSSGFAIYCAGLPPPPLRSHPESNRDRSSFPAPAVGRALRGRLTADIPHLTARVAPPIAGCGRLLSWGRDFRRSAKGAGRRPPCACRFRRG